MQTEFLVMVEYNQGYQGIKLPLLYSWRQGLILDLFVSKILVQIHKQKISVF